MRIRLLSLLLLLIPCAFSLHAQEVIIKRSTVVEYYKDKPYYIHFVNQGETLAAIARVYNITEDEINAENPTAAKGLKADMVLRIPQKPDSAVPAAKVAKPEKKKDISPPDIKKTEQIKPAVNKDETSKPSVVKPDTGTPAGNKAQTKPSVIAIDQEKPAGNQKEQTKPAVARDSPAPASNQEYVLYMVKKQETLYGIAKRYNVTVDDILKANPGIEGLKEDTEIRIPAKKLPEKPAVIETPVPKAGKTEVAPDEIVVKTGETLYSIAKTYHTSVDDLIDLNPQLVGGLKAGMVLQLHKAAGKAEVKNNTPPVAEKEIIPLVPALSGRGYSPDNIKKTYQVALLLPFLLDDAGAALEAPADKDPAGFENFNYFQFYAGFMLAADSLEKLGLKARIHVMDAERLSDTLIIRQTLRKPGMDKINLMVGPVYASSFAIAARYAQKHECVIVNPLSHRENIVEGNPYVVKAQVSGSAIADKLTAFITNHYPSANIIAVRNDNKELKSLTDDFASGIRDELGKHNFKGSLQESNYSVDQIAGLTKKLKPGVKNIVIFFSNNKTTVPNFVSLLNPLAKSDDILLIGMDGWDELELETEFLVNLNYHQVTSGYIDYESEAVQQFTASFRAKYGAVPVPGKHAFLGFDIGWYFLTSMMWYGDQYVTCLPEHKGKGLQYHFDFPAASGGDGLQNQNITIVKLEDYKMVKVE